MASVKVGQTVMPTSIDFLGDEPLVVDPVAAAFADVEEPEEVQAITPGATVVARGGGATVQGFADVAQSSTEALATLLKVDGCAVVRVFGTKIVSLTATPEFGLVPGLELPDPGKADDGPEPGTPGYVARAVAVHLGVPGYAAAGIYTSDGALFATLCVLNRTALSGDPEWFGRLLRYHSDVLGTQLGKELEAVRIGRQKDARSAKRLCLDTLTRLPDRRAWGMLLGKEDDRARALGHPAAVLVIDTGENHSSRKLRRYAQVLKDTAGSSPALCRLDERLWGVIVTGHDSEELTQLAYEIGDALRDVGAKPAIGGAQRTPNRDLVSAWSLADERVFASRKNASERA